MLAQYMLSSCLSVRPSVTSRYCIATSERIKLVFDTEAMDLGFSHFMLAGNSGLIKSNGTSLWYFVPNTGPRKKNFAAAHRPSPSVVNLGGLSVRQTGDSRRSPVYHSERLPLCTTLCARGSASRGSVCGS